MPSSSQPRSTCTSPHSKSHRMFEFRSLSYTLHECLCDRTTQSREKHLRRQTLQLLLEIIHHVNYENCTLLVLFQDPRCPDPPPRSSDVHLCQHLVGLLKLVMDGFKFLALLDTCIHGLLHSLNAFALCVQLMTHLIEEVCNSAGCDLTSLSSLSRSMIPFAQLLSHFTPSTHEASPLLKVSVRHLQACVLCASLLQSDLQRVCLLKQDRLSSHSSRRRSCVSRRSTAACSYSPLTKLLAAEDF